MRRSRCCSELDPADGLPEGLALDLGDLELECGGLARAIGARESASAPRRACGHCAGQHVVSVEHTKRSEIRVAPNCAMAGGKYDTHIAADTGNIVGKEGGLRKRGLTTADLREVRELTERLGVPEGHEDEAVVGERRERRDDRRLLAAAGGRGGHEHGRVLAVQLAARPKLAGRVPEVLPLRGEVAVTRGDTEDERVVVGQIVRGDDGVVGLGGGVHLLKDVLRESLGNPAYRPLVSECYGWHRTIGGTHWKMVADPPADSTPAFTPSATICANKREYSEHGRVDIRRTFGDMAVQGVDDDGDLGRRHGCRSSGLGSRSRGWLWGGGWRRLCRGSCVVCVIAFESLSGEAHSRERKR